MQSCGFMQSCGLMQRSPVMRFYGVLQSAGEKRSCDDNCCEDSIGESVWETHLCNAEFAIPRAFCIKSAVYVLECSRANDGCLVYVCLRRRVLPVALQLLSAHLQRCALAKLASARHTFLTSL